MELRTQLVVWASGALVACAAAAPQTGGAPLRTGGVQPPPSSTPVEVVAEVTDTLPSHARAQVVADPEAPPNTPCETPPPMRAATTGPGSLVDYDFANATLPVGMFAPVTYRNGGWSSDNPDGEGAEKEDGYTYTSSQDAVGTGDLDGDRQDEVVIAIADTAYVGGSSDTMIDVWVLGQSPDGFEVLRVLDPFAGGGGSHVLGVWVREGSMVVASETRPPAGASAYEDEDQTWAWVQSFQLPDDPAAEEMVLGAGGFALHCTAALSNRAGQATEG